MTAHDEVPYSAEYYQAFADGEATAQLVCGEQHAFIEAENADLRAELDRLRAENERLRADAYSLQEDVWSYQRRIDEMQDDVL